MKGKIASGLVLTTLWVCALTLAFDVKLLKASGTIYIRADGSVDPSTAPLQRDGDVYTFTANVFDSIVVERDNVIIDGAGCSLHGTPGMIGISVQLRNNVTLRKMKIEGFQFGILLGLSSNCHIFTNSVTGSFDVGIRVLECSENSVCENNVTRNDCGIFLSGGSQNHVCQNNVTGNNQYGIGLYDSLNNTVSENSITVNKVHGIWVSGDSSNNTVFRNSIETNMWGVWLGSSPNNTLSGNSITDNDEGIVVHASSNNIISENNITTSNNQGISLVSAHQNEISQNVIGNNSLGIGSSESQGNLMHNNILSSNGVGIRLTNSNSTELRSNVVTESESIGVRIESVGGAVCSFDNILTENLISFTKDTGFVMNYSLATTIYHNNFIENTNHAHIELSAGASNVWDDGYPSGGNYWDDYNDPDNYWGEHQDFNGSDMIGDVPYAIDEDNTDRYPLLTPWPTNHWAFEKCLLVAISNSTIMNFNFDQQIGEISFNVTADTSDVCKVIISKWLLDGAFNLFIDNVPATCSISWSPNYYLMNFTYSQGLHTVQIVGESVLRGDLDGDRYIGIKDLYLVASHFGESCP